MFRFLLNSATIVTETSIIAHSNAFQLRRGFKQDSGKRVSLFIVLREYHLMKLERPRQLKGFIFSVVCSSGQ